jgi:hypothetical protein
VKADTLRGWSKQASIDLGQRPGVTTVDARPGSRCWRLRSRNQPTIDYVTWRTAEGLSKRDIIRCLKRYVVREVFHLIHPAENAVLKTS